MQDPKGYKYCNNMQCRDVEVTLKEFSIKWTERNARIMDIGCGDGSVTMSIWKKYIPKNFMKIVGSDISQKCVDFAKELYGSERVEFMRLDMEGELPNELKGRFDHVVSSYALNWAQDQEKTFSNIYEMLAKDGNCLLIFLGYVDIYENYRTMSRTPKWSAALSNCEKSFMSPYHNSQDPATEISDLMRKIGFQDIDVKVQNKKFDFARGVDEFKMLMKSINVFDGLRDMWDDFMDDYVRLNPGAASTTYQLLIVSGTK